MAGTAEWRYHPIALDKNYGKINTLDCNTIYEWQVQAICDAGASEWTDISTFTTLDCRLGNDDELSVQVYPNPATNTLFIETDELISENVSIEIHDVTGNKLQQLTLNNEELLELDISSLPAGLYFANILSEGFSQSIQFIKSN